MEVAHDPCSPTRFTAYRHSGSDPESYCSAKARARSERTRAQKSDQRAGEGPCWLGIVGNWCVGTALIHSGCPRASKFPLPKEAEEQANKIRDPSAKQGFLNIAHQWRAIAEQAERQGSSAISLASGRRCAETRCALKRAACAHWVRRPRSVAAAIAEC
jgi:hypothetical protein